jgi:hypothetical protein
VPRSWSQTAAPYRIVSTRTSFDIVPLCGSGADPAHALAADDEPAPVVVHRPLVAATAECRNWPRSYPGRVPGRQTQRQHKHQRLPQQVADAWHERADAHGKGPPFEPCDLREFAA